MIGYITAYTIQEADDYYKLIDEVHEKVQEGWQPLGGVAIKSEIDTEGEQTSKFYQAMGLFSGVDVK